MTITALAAAPTRATTSLTLSFGMINIPVSVYTGTEETRVARKEFFFRDTSVEVGRAPIRKDTGEVIHPSDVLRMAQAESGAWVVLSDEEIAAATMPRGMAEFVSFVPVRKRDQYLTEGVKQVRPKREKGKPNYAAERAFGLLLTTMKSLKVLALVKLAMRGPARYGLLDSEGNLFLVYTADAVRQPVEFAHSAYSEAELNMAKMLIETVGIGAPTITDDTAPAVQAFVNDKAVGVETPEAVVNDIDPSADLLASLAASIEAAKAGKGAVA
jgi:non-homologous end joining protein Ku